LAAGGGAGCFAGGGGAPFFFSSSGVGWPVACAIVIVADCAVAGPAPWSRATDDRIVPARSRFLVLMMDRSLVLRMEWMKTTGLKTAALKTMSPEHAPGGARDRIRAGRPGGARTRQRNAGPE
jgi:hypothetical protein